MELGLGTIATLAAAGCDHILSFIPQMVREMTDERPLLEISDLEISFRNEDRISKVIKNIGLHIQPGEIVGLVGESGSGKSVTGLAIMGLLPVRQAMITGSIRFEGKNETEPLELTHLPEEKLRRIRGSRISMIFQEPMSSLNPVITCGAQVDEVAMVHLGYSRAAAKAHTLDLFARVGLPDPPRIYRSYPHQISGGQIQRVMIAMGLVCNPDLIIADEPTTALDVTIQKRILDLLREISNEFNVAILFISHDLGVIRQLCDRVYVMYKGIIAESGPTTEVLAEPAHLYTRSLIACKPPLRSRPERLPVVADFVHISHQGDEYNFIPAGETAPVEVASIEVDEAAQPILKVDNLVVRYPVKRNFWGVPVEYLYAVNDISFHLQPGETVGIVGESGCGKSTLGRSIAGLEQAYTGKILFRGSDLAAAGTVRGKETRKKIQIIFQDPYSSLNPRMRIGEAITEPMLVHQLHSNARGRRERMKELLAEVGLDPDWSGRYPHEFSGGQRQRISIARALALEPEILICDESVSALDVSVQAQILNLLKDLQANKKLSYLFISHDLSVVNFISHRIVVMNKGKIVEQGTAAKIYHHPSEHYTRQLIEAIPAWDH